MTEADIPSLEDLVTAYVAAEVLPDFLPQADVDRIRDERRKAALASIQKIRDASEETSLAMHHAFRPEVTAEVSVPLTDDADWEQIAKWCGGTIGSGPDGTDSGEWTSWLTLPSGEEVPSGMWITKGLDGQFRGRYEVAEPDETTLRQAEAIGWEAGTLTALTLAHYGPHDTLVLHETNPNQAFLPTGQQKPSRGHFVRVFLDKTNGLFPALVCKEPTSAPCRQPYGDCELVAVFEEDPPAVMEDYQGTRLVLLNAPISVLSRDEYETRWRLASPTQYTHREG